jgi:hypothetical protein
MVPAIEPLLVKKSKHAETAKPSDSPVRAGAGA